MATDYLIALSVDIPGGSDIVNKPCTVDFSYPDGQISDYTYPGTVLVWLTSNTVRIESVASNMEHGWVRANGGTLTIDTGGGLAFGISGFAKFE